MEKTKPAQRPSFKAQVFQPSKLQEIKKKKKKMENKKNKKYLSVSYAP